MIFSMDPTSGPTLDQEIVDSALKEAVERIGGSATWKEFVAQCSEDELPHDPLKPQKLFRSIDDPFQDSTEKRKYARKK